MFPTYNFIKKWSKLYIKDKFFASEALETKPWSNLYYNDKSKNMGIEIKTNKNIPTHKNRNKVNN